MRPLPKTARTTNGLSVLVGSEAKDHAFHSLILHAEAEAAICPRMHNGPCEVYTLLVSVAGALARIREQEFRRTA